MPLNSRTQNLRKSHIGDHLTESIHSALTRLTDCTNGGFVAVSECIQTRGYLRIFPDPRNAMTVATQIWPLHPHTQIQKRGSEVEIQKLRAHTTLDQQILCVFGHSYICGNVSLMILVIVTAWQSQSSQVNLSIDFHVLKLNI